MNGTVYSTGVNYITVSVSGVNYGVNLAYGGLVTLNGVTCNLSDLLPGDSVSLVTETEATNIPYATIVSATRS